MTIHLSIDRLQGVKKQIAVLLADDGTAINGPKGLLPKGVKAGDILTLQIERGVKAIDLVVVSHHHQDDYGGMSGWRAWGGTMSSATRTPRSWHC